MEVLSDSDVCAGFVVDVNVYVCWGKGFVSFDIGFDGNSIVFIESLVFTDRKKLRVSFDGVCIVFYYIACGGVRDYGVEDV